MLSYAHLSVGVMVENGSDLIENKKVVAGSYTVRQILDDPRPLAAVLRGAHCVLGLPIQQS